MLNREVYYKHIEEYLLLLAIRTEKAGKLNVLDLHLHSENFYRDFLNRLYGFNLENANVALQNVDSIDLLIEQTRLRFRSLLPILNRRLLILFQETPYKN